MKKYQYIVAIACVLVGVVGFASMYAIDQSQKKEQQDNSQLMENTQDEKSEIPLVENTREDESQLANHEDSELEPNVDGSEVANNEPDETEDASQNSEDDETPVGNVTQEVLHFQPEKGLVWPVQGPVLLDYSMNATIYYPTLEQYQYNPAMVIGGAVNDKVYFVAKGKITSIETNEETGCTVTQDLGDGYTAIYGQLKEVTFEVGDMVQSGQVVGYIDEPTKYYSVEGPNVYFQLFKDGTPIDPEEILPEE